MSWVEIKRGVTRESVQLATCFTRFSYLLNRFSVHRLKPFQLDVPLLRRSSQLGCSAKINTTNIWYHFEEKKAYRFARDSRKGKLSAAGGGSRSSLLSCSCCGAVPLSPGPIGERSCCGAVPLSPGPVQENETEAERWYRLAALQGHSIAKKKLKGFTAKTLKVSAGSALGSASSPGRAHCLRRLR